MTGVDVIFLISIAASLDLLLAFCELLMLLVLFTLLVIDMEDKLGSTKSEGSFEEGELLERLMSSSGSPIHESKGYIFIFLGEININIIIAELYTNFIPHK